jgi:hypothetical protein
LECKKEGENGRKGDGEKGRFFLVHNLESYFLGSRLLTKNYLPISSSPVLPVSPSPLLLVSKKSDDKYLETFESLTLPRLSAQILTEYLNLGKIAGQTAMLKAFRRYLRNEL